MLLAARSITVRPVSVLPVNITKSVSSIRASPVSLPPVAIPRTSWGNPDSRIISAVSTAVRGVSFDGFITTELPAMRAGTQSQKALTSG